MEKILHDQLYNYVTKFLLLSDCKFSFRKFHGTATALLDCTNSWYMNTDRKIFNLVVLIYLKKVGTLWSQRTCSISIKIVPHKSQPKMPTEWISFIHISSERLIKCGVPQGSNLGPLFFLNCHKTKPQLFADDTNLPATGKSISDVEIAMNSDLENLRKWLIANKLSLNVAKTEFLLIGSKPISNFISNAHPNVIIESEPINQVYECRTLGVTVDQHLSWKSNIENICKKNNIWNISSPTFKRIC